MIPLEVRLALAFWLTVQVALWIAMLDPRNETLVRAPDESKWKVALGNAIASGAFVLGLWCLIRLWYWAFHG